MAELAAQSELSAELAAGGGAGYFQQSRAPLASLVFVLPLLVLYEAGVLLGASGVRNGADAWLRNLLDAFGFSGYFLLPVLTVGVLFAWHHATRAPWRVRSHVLAGMLIESAALAMLLVGIAHVLGILFAPLMPVAEAAELALGTVAQQWLSRVTGFFGAGVYEEMLFRLMLLPAAVVLLRLAGLRPPWRVLGAIAGTSLVFSAAHYIGPYGDPLDAFTFFFRYCAGALFAVLFVYRGFGIAAGTHALYDVFVGLR